VVSLLLCMLSPLALAGWDPAARAIADYNRGVDALEVGEVEEAEQRFRTALAIDPSCGTCQAGLGNALFRQRRLTEAEVALDLAAEAHPTQAQTWANLALVRFALQDFVSARAAAEAGVRSDPADPDVMQALVTVLVRQGDLSSARAALDGARSGMAPGDWACLMGTVEVEARNMTAAVGHLEACKGARDPARAGVLAARLAQGSDALGSTAHVAALVGATTTLRLTQAVDLFNEGDFAGAETLLDQVLRDSPDNVSARMVRARCRFERGALDLARADLEGVLKGDTWVDVHRSGAISGILRPQDAVVVGRLIDESAGVLARIQARQGEVELAKLTLLTHRERLGPSAGVVAAEVEILGDAGDNTGAWAAANSGVVQFPNDAGLMLAIGKLAQQHSDGLSAPSAALSALEGSPRWSDHANLAVAWAKAGRYSACVQQAQGAAGLAGAADQTAMRELAWRCAVGTGDVALADGALAAVTPHIARAQLSEVGRANHANLLLEAKRPADAVALLAVAPFADTSVRTLATAVQLRAHVDLRDWTAAAAAASQREASPQDQVWVAALVGREGQERAARDLLVSACPRLEGDEAARCVELRTGFGG
jgi:Tfp pilus assembly protein PilF